MPGGEDETTSLLRSSSAQHGYSNGNGTEDLPSSLARLQARGELPSTLVCSPCWRKYNDLIESHPIAVKSLTGCVILSLGDMAGQLIEHLQRIHSTGLDVFNVDWVRVSRFAIFGLCGAPWSHYYFYYLDLYLPPTPQPFTRTTALKVIIDQFVQAPILLGVMISLLALLKGTGLIGILHDLRNTYGTALLANCKHTSVTSISSNWTDTLFLTPNHQQGNYGYRPA
jgi:hypothetical protein